MIAGIVVFIDSIRKVGRVKNIGELRKTYIVTTLVVND